MGLIELTLIDGSPLTVNASGVVSIEYAVTMDGRRDGGATRLGMINGESFMVALPYPEFKTRLLEMYEQLYSEIRQK